jgi:hypothetical protein
MQSQKKDYIWNSLGSLLQSAISPVLLIVITRLNGIEDSGLFSFALSLSVVFWAISLWGVIGAFSAFKYGLPLFILLPSFSLLFLSLLHYNKKDQELLGEQTGKLAVYNLATIGLFVCAVSYAMYTAWALLPFRFGEGAYYADGVQAFTDLVRVRNTPIQIRATVCLCDNLSF